MKNDRLGAKPLAKLYRVDMVARCYVPPKDFRELRSLAHSRKRLDEKRTGSKNGIHALLDIQGISFDWDPVCAAGRARLGSDEVERLPIARGLLESFLTVIDTLTHPITELNEKVEETAVASKPTQRLMTSHAESSYS